MADDLDLPYQTCTVEDRDVLDAALEDRGVLLNCAGPFRLTAPPLVSACRRTGTHYTDTTGELSVIHWIVSLDDEAQRREVMLLPGVGFDLVPSDYLARYLKTRLSSAVVLRLYRSGFDALSQGSASTLVDALRQPAFVRRQDRLVRVPIGWKRRIVDWGEGNREAVTIPWVDVLTAYRTTHVPNIEVYALAESRIVRAIRRLRYIKPFLAIPGIRRMLSSYLSRLGGAPGELSEDSRETLLFGEVSGCDGATAAALLRAPDAYTVTVLSAVTALQHICRGAIKPGFQTPASLLGGELIQEMDCFYVEDVD